jgi:hypothetical protein
MGSTNRSSWFRLGIKGDPISKITSAKRAGVMAQMAERLPSKCKTLKFKPQYHEKKKKNPLFLYGL